MSLLQTHDAVHDVLCPMTQIGLQAEQFVADYLEAHDWQILSRRYCSRWGELDLVARQGDTLSFVEVR